MKKLRLFTWAFMLLIAVSTFAQDGIHGVDGYYNWTAKQIKADNVLALVARTYYGSAATKAASINYFDDYVRINVGLANTNVTPLKFRSDLKLNYTVASPLKITKQYPVLAFKIGYPGTSVAKDFFHTFEIFWKFKIKEGDTVQARLTGAYANCFTNSSINATAFPYFKKNGNGTGTFGYGSWKTSPVGRFDFLAGGTGSWKTINGVYQYYFNKNCAIGDSVNTASTGSSTHQGYFKESDPIAENILYVNFKQVVDSVGDIEIYNFVNMLGDMVADSTKTVVLRNEAGDSIGIQTLAKTRDELPYYNIKWIKSFPTLAALKAQVAVNNGDGNDVRSDNQLILNAALYYAKKTLANYASVDPDYLTPYQNAFDAALSIYQSTAPNSDKTSTEWIAWDATIAKAVTDLATAKTNFLKSITIKPANPYISIKMINGQSDLKIGTDATVNTIPCKRIILGGSSSATPFVITKSISTVGGRDAYTLSDAGGKVCVYKDTLIYVANAKLASAALLSASPALFVISNRYTKDNPVYDISVNSKFLSINQSTGKLVLVTAIPDGDISELADYLFAVEPATYNGSGDNQSVLFSGWEFENGTTEGVERNTWRMYSNVEHKIIKGKGCLALGIASTYYTAQDSTHTTLLTSDFVTGMEGGYRRESGIYPNSAKLTPSRRDSSLIIWTNPYYKRYLAVKIAGTNPALRFVKMSLATDQIVIDIPLADTVGVKGDVYYWDLLKEGVPYGNIGWASQYFGVGSFTSADQVAYIDWIRTYANVNDIPYELLDINSAVNNPSESSVVKVYSNNRQVIVKTECRSEISLYDIRGQKLSTANATNATFKVNTSGVYIITARQNNQIITRKIVVE